jgi:hypothetical protein
MMADARDKIAVERMTAAMEIVEQIGHESPRGMILLVTSTLDELLGGVLRAYFVPEHDVTDKVLSGALRDFYERLHVARALGLIPTELHRDLDRLRVQRNVAAHLEWKKKQGRFSPFGEPELLELCRSLESVDQSTVEEGLRLGVPPHGILLGFVGVVVGALHELVLASVYLRRDPNLGLSEVRDMMTGVADPDTIRMAFDLAIYQAMSDAWPKTIDEGEE